MMETKLCEAEIRKNVVLVECNQPLTLPLAVLNKSCEFKRAYDKFYEKEKKDEVKAKKKAYNQKPENKAKAKAYNKAYYQKQKLKGELE